MFHKSIRNNLVLHAHTCLIDAHTCLIDSVLNDALSIVTGYLRLTSINSLPILSSIQLAEFRQPKTTLSLAYCEILDLDYILNGRLNRPLDVTKVNWHFRCPLVELYKDQRVLCEYIQAPYFYTNGQ